MSNVPALRFPGFASTSSAQGVGEWEEKRLKDYVEEHKGGAALKPKDFVRKSNCEVIPKKAIQSGGKLVLDKEEPTYCSEEFFNSNLRNIVDNRYLITTLRDLVPSGPSIGYIVRNNCNNSLILAQGVYGFIVNENLDKEFIIQFSNRIEYRRLMQKIMVGSTQVHIRNQDFFGIKLTLPPLPEQQKIASFLTAVDAKIAQLSQKGVLLGEYKRGVMQGIFSQEIRFLADDGSLFGDWVERRLGDLFTFLRGSNLSKSDMVLNGKYKCIHYGELFTTYKEKINLIKSFTNIENGQPSKKGDIYMPSSDVTPQGLATASTINENDVIIGGDINILRPKITINSLFVSYFLNASKKEIMKLVSGTTVKHIYNKDVSKLIIKLPQTIEEQTKIANFLSAIDTKIAQNTQSLEKMKTFKRGLLQQMFA